MTQKKEIKLVNPKWLLRQILKSLPAEAWVRSTVAALWMFCNDFIAEETIAHGTVSFSGTVSYSQLAGVLAIGESTAKWRMIQLRDKYELVEWERTKVGIKFTFGVYLSPDGECRTDERAATSSPATHFTDVWLEKFRMPLTRAQKDCERRTGHIWIDLLHTTQKCSACGTIRANLPPLTAEDDLEAEYMARVEANAPDYFPDPLANYESVDYPPLSAAFLEYLEGSPMPFTAEKRVR